MKMLRFAALAVCMPVAANAMTVADYWNDVSHRPGILVRDRPTVTVITDPENDTIYYFTKPGNPAHPGVIIRKRVGDAGGSYFDSEGHADGRETTPIFRAWMANPLQ